MQKRWYDVEPVLSRAIAMLEEADEDLQVVCAEYVIDKLKDIDFEMSLDEQYNYILRRWYDKNLPIARIFKSASCLQDEDFQNIMQGMYCSLSEDNGK